MNNYEAEPLHRRNTAEQGRNRVAEAESSPQDHLEAMLRYGSWTPVEGSVNANETRREVDLKWRWERRRRKTKQQWKIASQRRPEYTVASQSFYTPFKSDRMAENVPG